VNRRILAYLIPLRMLKGNLPSALLLSRFPNISTIYTPFINAIRAGDVQGYDRALEENELKLLDLNLWVSVEKARELCLRGLFRKVYVPLAFISALILDEFRRCLYPFPSSWLAVDKSTRMPISLFHTGLQVAGVHVDLEEAECYVANMIYKGLMRGYISHEKQTVVLAKENSFPKVSDRPNPFALI
jgi:hypothetical protein